jgi:cell division protease FtsH
MNGNGEGWVTRAGLLLALIVGTALLVVALVTVRPPHRGDQEVTLRQLAQEIKGSRVSGLVIAGETVRVAMADGRHVTVYKEPGVSLAQTLRAYGVTDQQLAAVEMAVEPAGDGGWLSVLVWMLPLVLFGALVLFLLRQSPGQGGASDQAFSFLKSRARKITFDRPRVRFSDAAGVEEAKQELIEVVEFLKQPEKFAAMGAHVPKGVLLVGPPGTGKTLLARAVAGEAGVPFFSISGSEFVEMFVGVGAARVRDLFEQARRNAPCIVFIDEIDAVGRQRGIGIGSGHDEREQTLNQILVELDGFDRTTNVIVMAATNRPDVLDPALLRPGRFDRRIVLTPPDLAGREAILRVHARGKPLAPEVDLAQVARQTAGFSGADLENLLNEAAILAARRNRSAIGPTEIEEAIDRILAGPQRRSRLIGPREKALTAYHEAGHALVAHLLPHVDPVHKISIIARGLSGGQTRIVPLEERQVWTYSQLMEHLAFILGGLAAEELVFGEISTGSQNDLEQATALARRMVCEYGMSERLGPVALSGRDGLRLWPGLGPLREPTTTDYSDATASEIDHEVRRLIGRAHHQARDVLERYRERLVALAEALIAQETLQGEELQRLLEGAGRPAVATGEGGGS